MDLTKQAFRVLHRNFIKDYADLRKRFDALKSESALNLHDLEILGCDIDDCFDRIRQELKEYIKLEDHELPSVVTAKEDETLWDELRASHMQLKSPVKVMLRGLPARLDDTDGTGSWWFCLSAGRVLFQSILLKYSRATAISRFETVVKKFPKKAAIYFEEQIWTFKQIDEYSNKIGHIFRRAGFQKGDVVALDMTNCPEYACIWLGLAKIGVITALINTNLKTLPLIHCITAASCKAVIYSADLAAAVYEIRTSLNSNMKYFQLGGDHLLENTVSLSEALKTVPSNSIATHIDPEDHLVYIYTSGTTGMPKAAILPHSRYLLMLIFWDVLIGLTPNDIDYNPLPLYHMAGGLLGISAAMQVGASVVIKKKFSASNFIDDCIKYNCTVAQYIGEMCRYMLAVKPKPTDSQHKLQKFVGNGLRPSIWTEFANRFQIPHIIEVYGSTEGNLQFVNTDNTVGAVGFIPQFIPIFSRYMGIIIKVDSETMEPIRGPNGLCIECAPGEVGMFVGLIPRVKSNVKRFYGYIDKKESSKKFIHDVFKKGDRAFVSGDLVMIDEFGYVYFKDRTGDTFRWKGENVATSEVEAILSKIIGLKDCIVYGVQVGELEGKAGLAAIADTSGSIDFASLASSLDKTLPKYAQPIFIRILPELELTGTFKLKKTSLVKEGFDPSIIKDPLYFRNGGSYVPLTKELYDQINSGKIQI